MRREVSAFLQALYSNGQALANGADNNQQNDCESCAAEEAADQNAKLLKRSPHRKSFLARRPNAQMQFEESVSVMVRLCKALTPLRGARGARSLD